MTSNIISSEYDVAIIGSSIAGSLTAYLLRNSKIKIAIIDKVEHPRIKVCGEGLSDIGFALLKDLCPELLKSNCNFRPFKSYKFLWPQNTLELSGREGNRGVCVSRKEIDNCLFDLIGSNTDKIQAGVRQLNSDNKVCEIVTDKGIIKSKFVIVAAGAGSNLENEIDNSRIKTDSPRFGLTSWWNCEKPHSINEVLIYPLDNIHIYITALTDTRINCSLLGSKKDIQAIAHSPKIVEDFLAQTFHQNITRDGTWKGSGPLGSKLKKLNSNNILFIGDAARSFDPASGLGMYHAIFGAKLASDFITSKLLSPDLKEKTFSKILTSHNYILSIYENMALLLPKLINNSKIFVVLKYSGILKFIELILKKVIFINLMLHKKISENVFPAYSKTSRGPIWTVYYGLFSLSVFILAVLLMNFRLFYGMSQPLVLIQKVRPWVFNTLLMLQFPLLHSFLLGKGKHLLTFGFKGEIAKKLTVTNYTFIASIQLLLVFGLWQFSDAWLFAFQGLPFWIFTSFFILSSLYLGKAMYDAGLGLQFGYAGWIAARRGTKVDYPDMPTEGTFKRCRQPIYFAFFLMLWLSPYFSLDKIILASIWSIYCFVGPVFKERRFARHYGERFKRYKSETPYFLPNFFNKAR